MNPTERSAQLRREADELLATIELAKLCASIGEITPTGSYLLDLMMYPDIDVYVPPATPRQLFEIVAALTEKHPVIRVNFLNGGSGELANALYIKPVIALGNWERPWKIDIWAADNDLIQRKNAELQKLAYKMTPQQRSLILEYKFSVLNEKGRTPMFSGIFIYRAIIEEGLCDFAEITDYLRDHSIDI